MIELFWRWFLWNS